MTESQLTAKLAKQLKAAGALIYPIIGNARAQAGWPDRIIVWRGRVILVEFKGPTTPISAAQRLVLRLINDRAPNTAFVVRFSNREYATLLNGAEQSDHVTAFAAIEFAFELGGK